MQRRRPGDAVDPEARPGLETAQRRVGARAEAAVDVAERESVRLGQELQLRDVPAHVAGAQRPGPEEVAAEPAERAARARPEHPVGDEALAPLEGAQPGDRLRSPYPVHGARIEAARAQTDL